MKRNKYRLRRTRNIYNYVRGWVYLLFRYIWRYLKKIIFGFDGGYERSARLWLNATILLVLATIFIAIYIKNDLDILITDNEKPETILAIALVKLLLIIAPLYAIRFSVRNYSANKHLIVVNQHKAVVMKTLLAFIGRKDLSSQLRGELLVMAVKETFNTPQTGFLNEKDQTTSIEQNIFDKITRNRSVD